MKLFLCKLFFMHLGKHFFFKQRLPANNFSVLFWPRSDTKKGSLFAAVNHYFNLKFYGGDQRIGEKRNLQSGLKSTAHERTFWHLWTHLFLSLRKGTTDYLFRLPEYRNTKLSCNPPHRTQCHSFFKHLYPLNLTKGAWPSDQRVGVANQRSRVRVPLWPLPVCFSVAPS